MNKSVVELFAGVGGFRVGLNKIKNIDNNGKAVENGNWDFVWANQWEPATRTQDAFDCYIKRFGKDSCSNEDITTVIKENIPDHTLLTGGFPCQDYSVARTKSGEKGIEGKKGVLWWQINDILLAKKPPFVLLENVDRLIKAPARQRGRDFGIILRCLNDAGYCVEWRVINAAEYGHPQKRRRTYIFAYNKNTNYYTQQCNVTPEEILLNKGMFAKSFPVSKLATKVSQTDLSSNSYNDLVDMTAEFKFNFENSGYLCDGIVYTAKTQPVLEDPITLFQIREQDSVDAKYQLTKNIDKFIYLKGSKKIPRVSKTGMEYNYSEGKMSFPDRLDMPGRTMLTSEGTVNRSSHVISDLQTGMLRIITPKEAERLNQFPDNWTNSGMTDSKRYFMMGNALVCGVIEKIGNQLNEIIDCE